MLEQAATEYFRREAEAMKRPEGADHAELLETVAVEFGVDAAVLTDAVLDQTLVGAG